LLWCRRPLPPGISCVSEMPLVVHAKAERHRLRLRVPRSAPALMSALVVLLAAGLYACARPQRVILYMEASWKEFLLPSEAASQDLRDTLRRLGCRLETVPTDGSYSASGADWRVLEEPLSGGNVALAVLSPFMKPIAGEMAGRNPELPVLYLGEIGASSGPMPPNMLSVSFDKRSAYREAGRELGLRLSGSAGAAPEAGGGDSDRRAAESDGRAMEKAAVIGSADALQEEIGAFREGFLESADEYLLMTRLVEDAGDEIRVRTLLADLKDKGARYYLFAVPRLLPSCMDFLLREGGVAILEDWERSGGAYSDNVFMTVEEDYAQTIAAAVEALRSGAAGEIAGVVRLVRNAAAAAEESREGAAS